MTVLEQLSDLLKFLDTPESITFDLDLYEQGTERYLIFNKVDNLIKINCQGMNGIDNSKSAVSWG
jgi:hypothetical protein